MTWGHHNRHHPRHVYEITVYDRAQGVLAQVSVKGNVRIAEFKREMEHSYRRCIGHITVVNKTIEEQRVITEEKQT